MTIIAQDNFDADTSGVIAPGFTAKVGSWAVGTVGPVSGSQSFGATSNTDGDFALYSGLAARADIVVTIACKMTSLPSAGTNAYYTALRMDSTYQNGYLLAVQTASSENNLTLYKRVGGSFSVVTSTAFDFSGWASGEIMMMESSGIGTAIQFRVWKSTGSRPSTASLSATDATFTSGQTGLYRAGISRPAAAVDNFVVDDGAVVVVAPGAPTIGTAVAGDGYVDVFFTASGSGGVATIFAATLSTGESATGTSSPIRVTASNGTARTAHVTATNGAGTSAPSAESNSVTPTAAPAPVTYPVTNTNVYFSPYNWYSDGGGTMQANNIKGISTFAWLNMRGGYLKFKATVAASGSIALAINTATLSAIGASGCPQIAWSIANGAIQSQLLVSGDTTLSLATGLSAGTYDVFVYFRGVYITQDGGQTQNYTTPNNRFQVSGITLSSGGTLSAPTVRSKKMIAYGDSITEGDLSNGGPRSATSQDASLTYGWLLAEALDAEVGIVGFYGMNWAWFNSSWPNYASGLSRLVSGALTPAPDYITINYGENDGDPGPASSTVTATLSAVSAAAPSAKIIDLIPFSGRARTNLTAATLPANGYRIDLALSEMLNGKLIWSYDGQHPNQRGHANLAVLLSYRVNSLSAAALVSRTVTLTGIKTDATTLATGLTGVKVSFRDASGPDVAGLLSYQSSAQTITGGVLSFTANTMLASGATGWLDIKAPGVNYCGAVVVA